MNAIRSNRLIRTVAVIAAFIGWVVLSNHCALSEMLVMKTAPAAAEKGGCCHHNSPPQHDGKPCPPMPEGCCKSLTVVVPDGAKLPVASLEGFGLPVAWMMVFTIGLPEPLDLASPTGLPPDVPGFVELVLHRSLRSHAPPFAA